MLEKPLVQLDELRRQRGLEIDAVLAPEGADADVLALGYPDDLGA
jgi:hypothetical protein